MDIFRKQKMLLLNFAAVYTNSFPNAFYMLQEYER